MSTRAFTTLSPDECVYAACCSRHANLHPVCASVLQPLSFAFSGRSPWKACDNQSCAGFIARVGKIHKTSIQSQRIQRHSSRRSADKITIGRSSGSSRPIDRRTRSGLTVSHHLRRHSASDSTPPSDVALRKSANSSGSARYCPRTGTRPRGSTRTTSSDALRRRGPGAKRGPGYRTR